MRRLRLIQSKRELEKIGFQILCVDIQKTTTRKLKDLSLTCAEGMNHDEIVAYFETWQ